MQITVRQAAQFELIETVRIYLECLHDDYGFLPQAYLDARNVADELAECEEWLAASGGRTRIFGAFCGDQMVGYIAVGPNTGEPAGYEGEVNNLFLRRDFRGQGIGLMLLRTGLEYLRALDCGRVILYNYHRSASNTYYRHLGGEVVYRTVQSPGGMDLDVDVFAWEVDRLLEILDARLQKYAGKG